MYEIITDSTKISTSGLLDAFGFEVELACPEAEMKIVAQDMVIHIANGIVGNQIEIDGRVSSYGYWPVFLQKRGTILEVLEYLPDGVTLQSGVRLTLECLKSQQATCLSAGSGFRPLRFNQILATTTEVLNGENCEGIRYEAPEHMSGWHMTGKSYNRDIKTLVLVKCGELSTARPDLLKYLALEPTFFFSSEDGYIGKNTR